MMASEDDQSATDISIYEEMFQNRYTEDDPDYKQTLTRPVIGPPCAKNWYVKPKRNDWNRQGNRNDNRQWNRDNRSSYGGHRDSRDRGYDNRNRGYDNRDRSYGNRDRGYDNRDRGYDNRNRGYDNQDRQSYQRQDRGYNR